MSDAGLLSNVLAVGVSYLVGGIPFGFILVRLLKGVDVRTVGSGNIGATNVARAAGPKVGMAAFLLDVIKGFAASTAIPFLAWSASNGVTQTSGAIDFARRMVVEPGFGDLRLLCGLAAIVGHVWPVFLRFRGGKGVATSLGVLLGLAPYPTLIALFIWAVVTRVSGYVSLGSIVAAAMLPVAFAIVNRYDLSARWHVLVFTILVAAIVIFRHSGNIRRLLDGTESRFSFRRPGARRRARK